MPLVSLGRACANVSQGHAGRGSWRVVEAWVSLPARAEAEAGKGGGGHALVQQPTGPGGGRRQRRAEGRTAARLGRGGGEGRGGSAGGSGGGCESCDRKRSRGVAESGRAIWRPCTGAIEFRPARNVVPPTANRGTWASGWGWGRVSVAEQPGRRASEARCGAGGRAEGSERGRGRRATVGSNGQRGRRRRSRTQDWLDGRDSIRFRTEAASCGAHFK